MFVAFDERRPNPDYDGPLTAIREVNMVRPYALLRAGFGYHKTLGMRRVTSSPVDLALGDDGRIFIVGRSGLGQGIRIINREDDNLGVFGGGDLQ